MINLKNMAAGVAALGIISGAVLGIEARYAKEHRLNLIAMRLEQKIVQDRYWWLKERLDKIHRAYPEGTIMPMGVRDECMELQREIEDTQRKLNKPEVQ